MKLIKKSTLAVLAEIRKRKSEFEEIIDSLEAKEVDLEKEAERFVQTKEFAECEGSPVMVLAKHFFELGLKAQQEPVSDDLEEAAEDYCKSTLVGSPYIKKNAFKADGNWQKEHLWKPADGDDLPEIDREVIALLDNGKVVFAHRPPEYWDGKDIVTGKITRNYPKTYDKGGWNQPNVKWWLDVELSKEIERTM